MTRLTVYRGGMLGLVIATSLTILSIIPPSYNHNSWARTSWITLTTTTTTTATATATGTSGHYSSSSSSSSSHITDSFGLWERCTFSGGQQQQQQRQHKQQQQQQCVAFPWGAERKCSPTPNQEEANSNSNSNSDDDDHHCSPFSKMWWTAAVVMSLVVPVLELGTLVMLKLLLGSGSGSRSGGGQILSISATEEIVGNGKGARRWSKWKLPAGMMILISGVQGFAVAIMAYLFDNDDLFLVPGYKLGSAWYLALMSSGTLSLTACGMVIGAWVLPSESEYKLVLSEKSRV